MKIQIKILQIVFFLFMFSSIALAQASYTATLINTNFGTTPQLAGLNDSAEVVSSSTTNYSDAQPFTYNIASGLISQLNLSPYSASLSAVNNYGYRIGHYYGTGFSYGIVQSGSIFSSPPNIDVVAPIQAGDQVRVIGISETLAPVVVGSSGNFLGTPLFNTFKAILWFQGVTYDINNYIAAPSGYSKVLAFANSINQLGQIVGTAADLVGGNYIQVPYMYDIPTATVLDLPIPSGFEGAAQDINNLQTTVGYLENSSLGNTFLPVMWTSNGSLVYLPTAAGNGLPLGSARAVNDNNIAVGGVYNSVNYYANALAAVWDLNTNTLTLLDNTTVSGVQAGCQLFQTIAINSLNQMLAWGYCAASGANSGYTQLYLVQ